MKKLFRCISKSILMTSLFFSLSESQNYSVEQIPNPFSNVIEAKLYAGRNNTIHIIGLSDTVTDTYFEEHKRILFLSTRSAGGFSNGFEVIDTGFASSTGFTGGNDTFNCSIAEDSNGQVVVAWSKQQVGWTDVSNEPGYFQVPYVKLGMKNSSAFQRLQQYRCSDYPSITVDHNNIFHFIRQSVRPLYPPSPDFNYYFYTSIIIYNQIHPDGVIDSTITLGKGFYPHIHVDKNGIVYALWLRADSSNSKYFQLVYTRKSGSGFDSIMTLKDSICGIWGESDVHDFPRNYSSFVDDAGTIYAGWTDNNDYYASKIFLAKVTQRNEITIDSLCGLSLWGESAVFSFDRIGISHILWRTLDYPVWSFHYTQGSSFENVFTTIRTFHSLYSSASDPVIVLDSKGIAHGLFNSYNGIGFIRDLHDGFDTSSSFYYGSSIGYGFSGPLQSRSFENSAFIDKTDQVWVLCSWNSLCLMSIDRSVTNVKAKMSQSRKFSLPQNYPNPFNPQTTIEYEIEVRTQVRLNITDILGREIIRLVDEMKIAGNYQTSFNANKFTSGVYFYTLQAGEFKQTRKMLLIK